jgi:hypothetical protein
MTIAYRGRGGNYIGDTITFDGQDTAGNVTVIKITGPGLPLQGVPMYNLNGEPGTGNTINVNPDGSWKFVWYSSNTMGIEKLQTARYTFTAIDLTNPDKSATTSVMLKRPDFYASASPSPARTGDYVDLTGSAELGISEVTIEVTDDAGTILHSYVSPVSASGYFNFGFHTDMKPGNYYFTVSNPSILNSLVIPLTIEPPQTPVPRQTDLSGTSEPAAAQVPAPSPAVTSGGASGSPSGTGTLPLSPLTAIIGLIIAGTCALAWSAGHRKP